jgi:hypothetical protein
MRKRSPASPRPTYFEQIPVEAVKRLLRAEMPGGDATGADQDSGHFHGVQFYNHPDALCRIVGTFLGEGLEQGAVAVLIVTPDHAAKIDSRLRDRGLDVDALKRQGAIVTFDARDTLESLMGGGMPNPGVFRRTVGGMLNDARRGQQPHAIRAYGEMVDLLWKDGLEAAAIRLETLWNQLAGTHDFSLLCGYSMGNFYKGAALDDIRRQHTHQVADDRMVRLEARLLHPATPAEL